MCPENLSCTAVNSRFDAVIYAEIRKNQWRQALRMMTQVKQQGLRLQERPALRAAAKGACWSLVLKVLKTMIDENQPGAPASVSEVTNACCRGGWQYALQVLGRIRNHHIEPSVESFNAISNSCEKVTRRVDDDSWKFSVQCLASASSKSLKASLISYNTAIATFGQGLHWYYSLSVFLSLQQHGFTPDDFSLNSLATACEKKFRWEAAVETLRLHRWCKVDVIGMNAVISACGNNGQWQSASAVLMDLFRKGISSSQISFAATASACEKANLWMRPLQLLRSGKAIAQLGPVIHGIVLDAMEKQGLWEETLAHFRLFRDLRLTLKDQMDPICVSAAVSACRENWRQTLFLTAEGIRHFPEGMSTEAWNACIHSCVGHVPILKLLEWMKASQFEPDMLSYAALDKPGLTLIAGSDTTELLIKTRLEAVAALRRLCFSQKGLSGFVQLFKRIKSECPAASCLRGTYPTMIAASSMTASLALKLHKKRPGLCHMEDYLSVIPMKALVELFCRFMTMQPSLLSTVCSKLGVCVDAARSQQLEAAFCNTEVEGLQRHCICLWRQTEVLNGDESIDEE